MEFLGRETVEVCRGCGEVLPRSYWRADGDVVCAACAEERQRRDESVERGCIERGLVSGWIAAVVVVFTQAVAWGLLARMEPLANEWMLRVYLEVAVSLGAGVVVGVAVRIGSGRRGGLSLQAMAALLVYFAALGSVAVSSGGSVGALALRTLLGPSPMRGPANMPPIVDTLFAMGLAWMVNREGQRLAISGPFRYAGR